MRSTLLLLLIFLPAGLASAQADFRFGGEVSTDFAAAVDGEVPTSAACLELRASGDVGSGFFPDASFEADVHGCYDAAVGAGEVRLGRAFATLYLDDVDLLVGQQVVFWGSADAFNPVDVINPRDLSTPLADAAEQKLPIPLLRGIVHAPADVTFDLVLVPVFRPSVLPGERWRPEQQLALPPEITVVGRAQPVNNQPEAKLSNLQYGARATFPINAFSGGDVSLSYFHGIRDTPTVTANLLPTETPGEVLLQPVLDYDTFDLVGVDFSVAVAPTVIRGEVAYTMTGDPDGTDPSIANHSLSATLGAEYTFPGGVFTSLQGMVDYLAGDDGEAGDLDLSALLASSYQVNSRVSLEGAWLHNLSDGSGLVSPNLSYQFADGVTGNVGALVLYGSEDSELGAFRSNSQLTLSLAYSF